MKNMRKHQKGASAIVTIIILGLLGYGAYIAIQYVPQTIESKSIDSILSNLETSNKSNPVTSEEDAKTRVIKQLQINEMNDMTENFSVKKRDGKYTIKFSYDRELNLVYKTQPMPYVKTLILN